MSPYPILNPQNPPSSLLVSARTVTTRSTAVQPLPVPQKSSAQHSPVYLLIRSTSSDTLPSIPLQEPLLLSHPLLRMTVPQNLTGDLSPSTTHKAPLVSIPNLLPTAPLHARSPALLFALVLYLFQISRNPMANSTPTPCAAPAFYVRPLAAVVGNQNSLPF